MKLLRPTHVRIDLDRLITNFQNIRGFHSNPFLCPMIKANAYGYGDKEVADALGKQGCRFLGVASVEEGLRLDGVLSSTKVLVFGFHGTDALRELQAHKLIPVVSCFSQLQSLVQEAKNPMEIHIKFNTGMNRLGFEIGDIPRILDLLLKNPLLQVQGLCTHLYSGEDFNNEDGVSSKQVDQFKKIQLQFSPSIAFHHVLNSAAMAALYKKSLPFPFGSRPGLLIYGVDPHKSLSLKPLIGPVMEFQSKIVTLQRVKSGQVVSYGGTWQANRNSVIGIVPAGYADGIPVGLSNKGEVLVKKRRVPIRGRVSMDYTMIDLTDLCGNPEDLMEQEVIFIGRQGDEQITVEEVADLSGHLTYEIMTGIGERVPRKYTMEL